MTKSDKENIPKTSRKKTILLSVGILLVAGIITAIIFLTEPSATKAGATRETAMLVEVVQPEKGDFRPTIIATGTVAPAREVILSPRVEGQVIEIAEGFVPGGFVEKGEILLRIDPADYLNNLQLRKSELEQAKAELKIEQGRQDVARQDYQLLGEEIATEDESLVLRQPQLNSVKARVEAAEAAVRQARLDLGRTSIEAPFDAHILNRDVNLGSQVSPGNQLGRLVGLDTYWVEVTVPQTKLKWLKFPTGNLETGSSVKVHNRSAWDQGVYRQGYLYRLIGNLEDQTRMARVLVAVPDPLVYQTDTSDLPSLIIGSFLEAEIEAEEIPDVVRINRDYLREEDQVWLMEDNKLQIREVDIVMNDAKFAYIREGLTENDKIVTTNLATVSEGAKLRLPDSSRNNLNRDSTSKHAENNLASKVREGGERP